MATLRQIEANRRNAQLSTGPRSVEGRAVTRLNALKTGIEAKTQIIRGEDSTALEALTAEYYERWSPTTPEIRVLVDSLISDEWLLRRLRRVEAESWDYRLIQLRSVMSESNHHMLGQVAYHDDGVFTRLQRRIDSAQRNYHRTLKELQRLQPDTPEIGFVPSDAPEPEVTDLESPQTTPPVPVLVPPPVDSHLTVLPPQTTTPTRSGPDAPPSARPAPVLVPPQADSHLTVLPPQTTTPTRSPGLG